VTQRHTRLLLSVAASMGRLSESEWVRQCERVRRCASLVGEVSQWRAYCEGEWPGQAPPDLDDGSSPSADPFLGSMSMSSREGSGETNLASGYGYAQSQASSGPDRGGMPGASTPQHRTRKVSPLPSPASQHPPLTTVSSSQSLQSQQSQSNVVEQKPISEFDPSTMKSLDGPGFNTLTASFPVPPSTLPGAPITPDRGSRIRKSSLVAMNISPSMIPSKQGVTPTEDQRRSVDSERVDSPTGANGSAGKGSRVAAMRDKYDKGNLPPSSPTSPPPREEEEGPEQKPKVHFRRTSINVADIASRYESPGGRTSLSSLPPTQSDSRPAFPAKTSDFTEEQNLSSSVSSLGKPTLTAEPSTISVGEKDGESGLGSASNLMLEPDNEQTIRAVDRNRRMQELRQLAFEEQERALQEQQRRLEAEGRELHKEKMRLASMRGGAESGSGEGSDLPRPDPPYRRPSYSQSYTHLPSASMASSSSPGTNSNRIRDPGPGPASPTSPSKQPQKLLSPRKPRTSLTSSSSVSLVPSIPKSMTPGHPLDCNCVSCVLNRPVDAPNPAHLRTPKSEKPKGFFRRLSMEVGNTFSLSDSGRKRSNSNLNLQSAVHASTVAGAGSGLYGLGSGVSNTSFTATGGSGGQYMRGAAAPAANEIGVLPRYDYFPSRR